MNGIVSICIACYLLAVVLYLLFMFATTVYNNRKKGGAWGFTRRWYNGKFQWVLYSELGKLGLGRWGL